MKIVFLTFHNWETKRIGGFHKFAEACADAGHEVVFFSSDRPYYIYFKKDERLNKEVLFKLKDGIEYYTSNGNKIINCTWPSLRAPMPIYRYLPKWVNAWLCSHSLSSFERFKSKYLKGTDIFVFESCDCIDLFDKIKKNFPNSKFVYRPSDPLVTFNDNDITEKEWNVMSKSDINILVNQEGLDLYRRTFKNFDEKVNFTILSNGVDVEKFSLTYARPAALNKPNTALYVGAREAQWDLILYAANQCPNINFVIVCPETPPEKFLNSTLDNLQYIPGISPQEVPAWITNCNVVIIPNPKGRWKIMPWGITAKYYQAMKAKKPIVSYEDTPRLKTEFNINVAYSKEQFVLYLNKAIVEEAVVEYCLENKNWADITKNFIDIIKNL